LCEGIRMPTSHSLIKSPWKDRLLNLASLARRRVVAAAPFITSEALAEFIGAIRHPGEIQVVIGTTLSSSSVVHGSLDLDALRWACSELPRLQLKHIPRLHAKIYIADDAAAIITSGNLTMASLVHNNEYGVGIFDQETVVAVKRDLDSYISLGSEVSCDSVTILANLAKRLAIGEAYDRDESIKPAMDEFDDLVRGLRGNASESRTTIFARTVQYALLHGPMKTSDIHEMVKDIQPDLCDDNIERVINGVRFGKRWKHDVRNAQQTLRKRGQITLEADGTWRLI